MRRSSFPAPDTLAHPAAPAAPVARARPRAAVAALLAAVLLAAAPRAHALGFQAVFSKDGLDTWAVGDTGLVWRSFDGLQTVKQSSFGATTLRAVAARRFTVIVAGDSGRVWRSVDNGGSWAVVTIAGAPAIRAAAMTGATGVVLCGDGGLVLCSADDGASWSAGAGGGTQTLRALAFADSLTGWAAGDAGTLLATGDGGATWSPVATGAAAPLRALALGGGDLWVGGDGGLLLHAPAGGGTFTAVPLHSDAWPDVRALAFAPSGALWVGGGGGFLRATADAGATWTWAAQDLHGTVAALAFAGGSGWAANGKAKAVARSADGGATWTLGGGGVVTRTWAQVLASNAAVRGATLAPNALDRRVVYALLGNGLWRSPDAGETWVQRATLAGVNRANALLVSPRDTSLMVCAAVTTGGSRQLMRSTDGGLSWSVRLTHAFGEYGNPLEMDPDRPDTLLFGGDADTLERSTDFGQTWAKFGSHSFLSPCDLVWVPGADHVVQVGDGITGTGNAQLWTSTDGGATFALAQTVAGSEVPGMACSRLRNTVTVATTWTAAGARMTSDQGATWPLIADLNRSGQTIANTWGAGIALDDPDLVFVGEYSGGSQFVSVDGGATFGATSLLTASYAFLALDRANVLAQQNDGLYKLRAAYAFSPAGLQTLALTSPVGGETWAAGETREITWNSTFLGLARIEWRAGPADAWQPVGEVEGYLGRYAWTVPAVATAQAQVRVRDAWDGAPADSSHAPFTIGVAAWSAAPAALDLGGVDPSRPATGAFTLADTGSAALVVSQVSSDNPRFAPGRTAFTLAAGAHDTLGVTFTPAGAGADSATLTLTANDAGSPHRLRVRAEAGVLAAEGGGPAAFALAQNAPNPCRARTLIRFDVPRATHVTLEVFDLGGRCVATLADADYPPGTYGVTLDAGAPAGRPARLAGGVYFYRLRAPGFSATRRLLVMP